MMAKRKGKNRQCLAACPENQATRRAARTSGLPLTVPLSIPAYWTPERREDAIREIYGLPPKHAS